MNLLRIPKSVQKEAKAPITRCVILQKKVNEFLESKGLTVVAGERNGSKFFGVEVVYDTKARKYHLFSNYETYGHGNGTPILLKVRSFLLELVENERLGIIAS